MVGRARGPGYVFVNFENCEWLSCSTWRFCRFGYKLVRDLIFPHLLGKIGKNPEPGCDLVVPCVSIGILAFANFGEG